MTRGDATGIRGDATVTRGDTTGTRGDATVTRGDTTGTRGERTSSGLLLCAPLLHWSHTLKYLMSPR